MECVCLFMGALGLFVFSCSMIYFSPSIYSTSFAAALLCYSFLHFALVLLLLLCVCFVCRSNTHGYTNTNSENNTHRMFAHFGHENSNYWKSSLLHVVFARNFHKSLDVCTFFTLILRIYTDTMCDVLCWVCERVPCLLACSQPHKSLTIYVYGYMDCLWFCWQRVNKWWCVCTFEMLSRWYTLLMPLASANIYYICVCACDVRGVSKKI